jgi:hypothetical protein
LPRACTHTASGTTSKKIKTRSQSSWNLLLAGISFGPQNFCFPALPCLLLRPTITDCPEYVQRGLNRCIAEGFCFPCVHFHTLFNRTVENFYKKFIFSSPFGGGMVSKMPARMSTILSRRDREFSFPKRNSAAWCSHACQLRPFASACYHQVRGCKMFSPE